MTAHAPAATRARAVALFSQGVSISEISREISYHIDTVEVWIKKAFETKSIAKAKAFAHTANMAEKDKSDATDPEDLPLTRREAAALRAEIAANKKQEAPAAKPEAPATPAAKPEEKPKRRCLVEDIIN